MCLWTRTFVELLMKPTRILKIFAIQYYFWMRLFHYYAFINHVASPFLSSLYTSVYIMHGAFYKVNTPIKFMYNVSLPSANRCPACIPIFCPIVLGGKKSRGHPFRSSNTHACLIDGTFIKPCSNSIAKSLSKWNPGRLLSRKFPGEDVWLRSSVCGSMAVLTRFYWRWLELVVRPFFCLFYEVRWKFRFSPNLYTKSRVKYGFYMN